MYLIFVVNNFIECFKSDMQGLDAASIFEFD